MVDIFNFLYFKFSGNNPFISRMQIYSAGRLAIRYLCNLIIPMWFFLSRSEVAHRKHVAVNSNDQLLIVSLTSFPDRIGKTWIAIESLLRQSIPADFVVLWLSEEQFPSLESVPQSLLKLRSRGLRIEIRKGDLRSHKKYIYALREFPGANLILADDDIYYPSNMIENLMNASRKYKNKVICRFTKKIRRQLNGDILPYLDWTKVNDGSLGSEYFFGSGGGVLIPPGAISPDATNEDVLSTVTPHADDVWLNAMCRLVCCEFYSLKEPFVLLPILNIGSEDLSSINNGLSLNDVQIRAVRDYCISIHGVDPFKSSECAEIL